MIESPEPRTETTPEAQPGTLVPFDRLTLWEVVGYLFRSPRRTFRDLGQLLAARDEPGEHEAAAAPVVVVKPTPSPPAAYTARAAAVKPAGLRQLALLHASQCAMVLLLLLAVLAAPGASLPFRPQAWVLLLWMFANGAALYAVWRGWPEPSARARSALRMSDGFLTVLSMLAMLQWAGHAGRSNIPVFVWLAGILGGLNLIANALLFSGAGEDTPLPLWLNNAWDYALLMGMWVAFTLGVAADWLFLGGRVFVRRTSDLFGRGAPVLYIAMAVWGVVIVVAWQQRWIFTWLAARRAGKPMPRRRPRRREPSPAAPVREARREAGVTAGVVVGVLALFMSLLALAVVNPVLEDADSPLALGAALWVAVTLLIGGGSLGALLVWGFPWWRVVTGQAALGLSVLAFHGSAGNLFTAGGVIAWIGSIIAWWLALRDPAEPGAQVRRWAARARAWLKWPVLNVRVDWTLALLVVIMVAAAFFRFYDLEGVPPEMTSDHVEKLLDGARVFGDLGMLNVGAQPYEPQPQIFFPNNGGREPIQMYLVSLAAHLTGLGFTFTTLKIVSALEALLTVLLLYWMGKEFAGRRAGLILAGMVAISYWHTLLGRLALRIVLTPLFMALLLVYLARAMTHNRRSDYLKAGLVLGVSVYGYQAMRMAPLIVLAGVALAVMYGARRSRDVGRLRDAGRYALNLLALAVVAVAVFVPMGRVMVNSPDDFWRRTSGRLGLDEGQVVEDPLGQFVANYNGALWMFNWQSEVQWISNLPNQPQLSPVAGALLALGVVLWGVRLAQRRDPVDLMLVLAVLIMLLPSTLSIAMPDENPSATRASGVLPVVYLWAAVALDAVLAQTEKTFKPGVKRLALAGVVLVVFVSTAVFNYDLYFNHYRESYRWSAKPYTEIGKTVRGFANSIGSMETAFVVAYPHWLDHRAVGIDAGDINWVNADKLVVREDLPRYIPPERTTALMIIYDQRDKDTAAYLEAMFPDGHVTLHRVPGEDRSKDFYVFIVPAPPVESQPAENPEG